MKILIEHSLTRRDFKAAAIGSVATLILLALVYTIGNASDVWWLIGHLWDVVRGYESLNEKVADNIWGGLIVLSVVSVLVWVFKE